MITSIRWIYDWEGAPFTEAFTDRGSCRFPSHIDQSSLQTRLNSYRARTGAA